MRDVSIGVDTGGTFTDLVCFEGNQLKGVLKVPSNRAHPDQAVINAIRRMEETLSVSPAAVRRFVHGTTVATNAVLERRGGRIGLLMTAGYRDVLDIGRSYRSDVYGLFLKPGTPGFLAPRSRRMEVTGRLGPDGAEIEPLDPDSLDAAIRALLEQNVDAIAVSFLFSFVNPAHELAARDAIKRLAPSVSVSLSHEADPTFREYERTAVTAFDAYVKPTLDRYIQTLAASLDEAGVTAPFQVMQSRGGVCAASIARERPVRLFLSGPAGGVIGALGVGRDTGIDDIISFDVGGTSCDIALIDGGKPAIRQTGYVDGFVVRAPMVDVNAIGAGGGSIAWIDGSGGLRVGPHSAGSDPGPACYGWGGTEPTVTDASLYLGYIDPAYFAGGTLTLQPELARKAIVDLATRLGLPPEATAHGIHRVVTAQMAEGIRLVSVKRGIDPRGFALLPLGGGGGIHAIALARELGMTRVLVPRFPGVLAANGLVAAPITHEASVAINRDVADIASPELGAAITDLDRRCQQLMAAEEVAEADVGIEHFADVCFKGQSHTLEVSIDLARIRADQDLSSIHADFREVHERVHGHSEDAPTRIVNVRAVATYEPFAGAAADAALPKGEARKGTRTIFGADGVELEAAIYDRHLLQPGTRLEGPAILEQSDTTTLLEPGWHLVVLESGSLLMEPTR